jgi:hypothetical protein
VFGINFIYSLLKKLNIMKNLKPPLYVFLIILLTANIGFGQSKEKSKLKVYGKVLANKKADITVFQEKKRDWCKIRTLKSRSKYSLELSPEENYYIVFISPDGIKKALYVNGGREGSWVMHLNVDFNQWTVKHATLFQRAKGSNYGIKVTHKNNENITINDMLISKAGE